jgi:hypothetical protein
VEQRRAAGNPAGGGGGVEIGAGLDLHPGDLGFPELAASISGVSGSPGSPSRALRRRAVLSQPPRFPTRPARHLATVTGAADDPEAFLAQNRATGVVGTVDEALEKLGELEDAGVERVFLQHLDHRDLEMVELIGRELAP